jgi:hypothetical protein
MAWGGVDWVLRALEGRGGGAGRRGGAGQRRPARSGRWGGAWRLETALTGRPHLSAAREGKRAGWSEVGRLLGFGPHVKKERRKNKQAGLG